jgi:flagellar biosynthetic protein FliR
MLAFFAVNGHHQILRALVASYDGLPIGGGHIDASILTSVRQIFALIFTVGVRLAAPLVLVLLIVELAIGLVSRSAPSLNFMVIGYPVRVVVGLIVLAAMVGTVPQVIAAVVERSVAIGLDLAAAFK